jgi:hypothetical protein
MGCSRSASQYAVEGEFEFGYDGAIKIAADNPFQATISNDGEAFKGELRIEIEDGNNGILVVSQPFEIAQNAKKEIKMDVPVFKIQKDYEVYITVDDEKIYEDVIKITDFVSPEQTVMAVITDTPDNYRYLENISLSQAFSDSTKYEVNYYSSTAYEDNQIRVFYFDSLEDLSTSARLDYFQYIYMGQIQTLEIADETEQNLMNWVERGNILVVETGANYKKVNSLIPASFQNYLITDTEKKQIDYLWYDLLLNDEVEIAIGEVNTNNETILTSYNDNIIGASSHYNNGYIVTLCVNTALEPIQTWNLKDAFISQILSTVISNGSYQNYYDNNDYYRYQYQLRTIPTDKKPPYLFMIVLFIIYILITGPIGYLILKITDKRDLGWVLIPALSIFFVGILYFFGYATRFSQPVLNAISIISYEEGSETAEVTSYINILNNQNDGIAIEWDEDEEIFVNLTDNDYYYYEYDEDNGNITGLMTVGSRMKYEKYESSLWSSNYINASKELSMSADNIVNVTIDDDEVEVNINNTLPFDLEDVFVVWNNNFIYVGDILEGESASATEVVNQIKTTDFNTFFEDNFGSVYNNYSGGSSQVDYELTRKYEILSNRYDYYDMNMGYDSSIEFGNVLICALNSNDIGYDLVVNGSETENFNMNIIEIETSIDFLPGTNVTINESLLSPKITYALDSNFTKEGEYYYDGYEDVYTFYESGIVELSYHIPDYIDVNNMTIYLGDFYNEEDYYENRYTGGIIGLENINCSIYNNQTDRFEGTSQEIFINPKTNIDANGYIRIRMNMMGEGNDYSYAKIMTNPTLTLEGSIK